LALTPDLRAIAFTGSLKAGMSLITTAQTRSVPIPVFAEMGSINPVFILPNALVARGEELAGGYAESLTMGVGQFCTNPGVVIGIESPALDEFTKVVAAKLDSMSLAPMLSSGIRTNFEQGVAKLAAKAGEEVTSGSGGRLFSVTALEFAERKDLREECFGPAGVVVKCQNEEDLLEAAKVFDGQLTATIQMDELDADLAKRLRPIVTNFAGRVVFNGFPTGVEVGHAMQHGGPFPAASDSRFTSVGTQAIFRFLRPVAIQNQPPYL
jgi:NADP-dependent aldehyde dehydrogenase